MSKNIPCLTKQIAMIGMLVITMLGMLVITINFWRNVSSLVTVDVDYDHMILYNLSSKTPSLKVLTSPFWSLLFIMLWTMTFAHVTR